MNTYKIFSVVLGIIGIVLCLNKFTKLQKESQFIEPSVFDFDGSIKYSEQYKVAVENNENIGAYLQLLEYDYAFILLKGIVYYLIFEYVTEINIFKYTVILNGISDIIENTLAYQAIKKKTFSNMNVYPSVSKFKWLMAGINTISILILIILKAFSFIR